LVPADLRVAVGFGSLVVENDRLREENEILREAVGDMNRVLEAAVQTLGLEEA
jgi:regulator of replication initiation timing